MIELQAHYIDLLGKAIEADRHVPMIRIIHETGGVIYAARSDTSTFVDYTIAYTFGAKDFRLVACFRDGRPEVDFHGTYLDGLDPFWGAFQKALAANRLSHVAKEKDHV